MKHEALLIGINYIRTPDVTLKGCINDVLRTAKRLIINDCGFNITIMTDDKKAVIRDMVEELILDNPKGDNVDSVLSQNPDPKWRRIVSEHYIKRGTWRRPNVTYNIQEKPTKGRILEEFRQIADRTIGGANIVIHYAGHGVSIRDQGTDERDGRDEAIVPIDFSRAGGGIITDDEIYDELVNRLDFGCKVFTIFDCCHSGTILDLQWGLNVQEKENGGLRLRWLRDRGDRRPRSRADIVMLSGCADYEKSSETMFGDSHFGALSHYLHEAIDEMPDLSLFWTLMVVRKKLKDKGIEQVPKLTTNNTTTNINSTPFGVT